MHLGKGLIKRRQGRFDCVGYTGFYFGSIAYVVEQWFESPRKNMRAVLLPPFNVYVTQLVESLPSKQVAAGSSPVVHSISLF